jgi:hypothetical protein
VGVLERRSYMDSRAKLRNDLTATAVEIFFRDGISLKEAGAKARSIFRRMYFWFPIEFQLLYGNERP